MPQERLRLVVGLGNPGKSYGATRHNAGFMVLDEVADAYGIGFNHRKFEAVFGRGSINGVKVILAKPMAFMNRSGRPVRKVADYFRILCEDMLVIHDDIDLALGRLKIKEKGGDGGHKGLRSIIDAFGGGVSRVSASVSGVPRLMLRIMCWADLARMKKRFCRISSPGLGMQ